MVTLEGITPILRIFDVARAHEFYLGYLGFEVQWEHRFGGDSPLYTEIRRAQCVLHLSEHHGDATPGSSIRIRVGNIAALHAELSATKYRFARPGLEHTPWRTREISVTDPFGNRLHFYEPLAGAQP